MIDKNEIETILKSTPLDLTTLSTVLKVNEDDLKFMLDNMVLNGELKISKSTGLYKIANSQRLNKDSIFNFILQNRYIKENNLFAKFKNKKELNAILIELEKERKIVYDKKYSIYSVLQKAIISVKDKGYAFARLIDEEIDYYVSANDLIDAYNSDTCLVYPISKSLEDRLYNARIFEIVERGHKDIVGTLTEKKRLNKKNGGYIVSYYIQSNMLSFPVCAKVAPTDLNGAVVGTIVLGKLEYKSTGLFATVIDTVGHKDDPGVDISQIALEYGFVTEFPLDVLEEIQGISDVVLENQYNGRRDFRDKTVITIDGDDSKDFDDAVYCEKLPDGNYQLEVYIADVSEYVKENSPLDNEAIKRGTSVYLADRVIPMLPHKLSNGICSLNEGVDRLVLACLMEIDPKGNLVNYEITEGVIKSHHRMTYKKVNKILTGDLELQKEYFDIVDMLFIMQELSKIIRERRYKRGGIDFDTNEYKFSLDDKGVPVEISLRERDDAEKLIEDFMLEANETVAYHMSIMHLPSMYRVHEKPDQEKLHQVFDNISDLVPKIKKVKNDIHPKQIQTLLKDLKDNPNYLILNNMILRSMMKAKYSSECLGHYGLAMHYYCHFTSPIRRYPDLITHRMIKKLYLHPSKNLEKDISKYSELMPEVGLKTSASERRAIDCERAVDDMLFAWYMSSRIGNTYNGVVTSITSFGMFITLSNGVEGLVAYRNMDGYFDYNEKLCFATDGKRTFKLGSKVKIVVVYASKKERRIDFVLDDDYKKKDGFYEDNMY